MALNRLAQLGSLSDEMAALAERVRASVVVVRGSRAGGGAGVVWDERGLIVTNHHVVPDERAEVVLGNGARLAARVMTRAEDLDLAALQIERNGPIGGLVPATVGDSARLRVGELVLAVGNPLGERNAATLGVVSGTGSTSWPAGPREVIQAAVTLQPGNSGGALADVHGRIVGIPHMVVGAGLALAVPSHVVERFLASDRNSRAFFGFGGRWVELPPHLVDRNHLPTRVGMLLLTVTPESPAERAGLTIGDIVVGVARRDADGAGEPVDLLARLHRTPIGQPVRLAVVRAGHLHWFEATPRAA